MKIAHCPHCRDIIATFNKQGGQQIGLKHMRRAHTDHGTRRNRRVLIRNGRKA